MLPRGGAERLEEKRVYAIPVDNTVYDQIDAEIDQRGAVAGEFSSSADWWDDRSFLHFLYTAVNPARFAYFGAFLKEHAPPTTPTAGHVVTLLDVGCGGGFLAEAFSRRGYRVTGIDPSGPSLASAQAHAQLHCLDALTYVQGFGESLPFASDSFDVVCCCDVLEHVESRDAVLAEIARVLRPAGGIFLYDA